MAKVMREQTSGHPYVLRSSELSRMSPETKRGLLEAIASAAAGPPNGQMGYVEEAIATFEARHAMTTDEMLAASRAGQLADTPDNARWLILASVR